VIEKRRSPIQGWGVFATRPITKNTRIVDYAGEKINNRESLRREKRYLKKGHIWCFKLNRLYVRDAGVGGNIARFINHKCEPNCYTRVIGDTIWIVAARTSARGKSCRTTIRLTAKAPSSAGASRDARRSSDGDLPQMVIYLHGFASSGHSGKAAYLGERLRAAASEFHAPDLNLPDFLDADGDADARADARADRTATEPVTLIGRASGASSRSMPR
jgi:hypothetical protein